MFFLMVTKMLLGMNLGIDALCIIRRISVNGFLSSRDQSIIFLSVVARSPTSFGIGRSSLELSLHWVFRLTTNLHRCSLILTQHLSYTPTTHNGNRVREEEYYLGSQKTQQVMFYLNQNKDTSNGLAMEFKQGSWHRSQYQACMSCLQQMLQTKQHTFSSGEIINA